MVRSIPDYPICQTIVINYSLCLIKTVRSSEAVSVLEDLSEAKEKPASYYVNLSLAYLHLNKPYETELTALEGLQKYKDDDDMIGNLLIAQRKQRKYSEAMKTAEYRLQRKRDVHSLEEVANLLTDLGGLTIDSDWPLSVMYFKRLSIC